MFTALGCSKDQGNQFLGGTTALLKAHVGITLELVAREACQILGTSSSGHYTLALLTDQPDPIIGGISHTRGGRGERIERIYRDVRGKYSLNAGLSSLFYIYIYLVCRHRDSRHVQFGLQ